MWPSWAAPRAAARSGSTLAAVSGLKSRAIRAMPRISSRVCMPQIVVATGSDIA